MKILQLRFKNLNSLHGEWVIDFTAPQYLANGIFALTGPTGAGKSTILDAICLALYGSTPRLGKITKNNNDIMSRQTGECYAEVCFESSEGRFRCHWSQHRARKKPDGKLAESKHEIADADSGEILESKKRDVALVIEAKTGMDFERFTRSILLAQGGFDTFLKADIEQKSKILEQITGTDIYSKISQRSHEKLKEEREQLNLLRAEIAGINLLTEDEQQDIEQKLETQGLQQKKLTEQLSKLQKAIDWLKNIDTISDEIKTLNMESAQLGQEIKAFIPQRKKLNLAIKASHLDAVYATLNALRKQLKGDQRQLETEQQKLPELEVKLQDSQTEYHQAERLLSESKTNLQDMASVFKQVRALDQHLNSKKQQVEKLQEDYLHSAEQIQTEQQLIENLQIKSLQISQQRQQVERYLEEHSKDQRLVSGLTGIKAQLSRLTSIQKQRKNTTEQYKLKLKTQEQQQQKLQDSNTLFDARKQNLNNIQQQSAQEEQHLKQVLQKRLLREYRSEKDALLRELSLLKTIADLEDERKKLQDNKPCPLCGSREHPYAMGNVPVMDETEQQLQQLDSIITQAEKIEAGIKQLAESEKTAQQKLSECEKQQQADKHGLQTIEQTLSKLEEDLSYYEREFNELKNGLLEYLTPLGFDKLDNTDLFALLNKLQARLQTWQEYQQQLMSFEQQLSACNADIKTHQGIMEAHKNSARIKQEQLHKETEVLEQLRAERQKLFARKDPDKEEVQLKEAINKAEHSEKQSREIHSKVQQELNAIKVNISTLEQRIKQYVIDLKTREEDFKQQLPRQGFVDEAEFIQSSLSIQERELLNNTAQELDNRKIRINTRLTDKKRQLTAEQSKNMTQKDWQSLQSEQHNLEQELANIREQLAAFKLRLEQNRTDKDKIKQKQSAIELQEKECQRWEKLHALIGSADGKKYRNFAQGLTFELMVAHANRQLKNMSDRYLLVRDKYLPLELNVADNYQGGEIRSVRNLSGGESFIVSLNLALGLSKMASRKVRVDSLFLDEGFGSLDEEALESALEALSGLHQDGKLIGIVSHVSALKERISTQIQVIPQAGGKSRLQGPGCSSTSL